MDNIKATTFQNVFVWIILFLMLERLVDACPFDHYPIYGHMTCQKCPDCPVGKGLDIDCNSIRFIPQTKVPQCMVCAKGTFSDTTGNEKCILCKAECDAAKHEKETQECTIYQDRRCGCKSGYQDHPVRGGCVECCECDPDGHGTEIRTCPLEKRCAATRKDGKCNKPPSVITKASTPSVTSTPPIYASTTTPAVPVRTPTIMPSNAPKVSSEIITIICVVVTAVLIAGVIVFCKRKIICSGRSGHPVDAEVGEMMQRYESQEDLHARPGNPVLLSALKWEHIERLIGLLDPREGRYWLHIGEYLAAMDKSLRDRVKSCDRCGAPCKAMFTHLAVSYPDLSCMVFLTTANKLQRNDVAKYLENNGLLDGLFSDLADSHQLKIADLLHQDIKRVQDWRAFASKFGFSDEEIKGFDLASREPRNSSPTREMIRVLIQYKPALTIQEFQSAAVVNFRNDVKLYLDEVITRMNINVVSLPLCI